MRILKYLYMSLSSPPITCSQQSHTCTIRNVVLGVTVIRFTRPKANKMSLFGAALSVRLNHYNLTLSAEAWETCRSFVQYHWITNACRSFVQYHWITNACRSFVQYHWITNACRSFVQYHWITNACRSFVQYHWITNANKTLYKWYPPTQFCIWSWNYTFAKGFSVPSYVNTSANSWVSLKGELSKPRLFPGEFARTNPKSM